MFASISKSLVCAYGVAAGIVSAAGAQTRSFDADALPVLTATRQARIGHIDDAKLGFSRIGQVDVDREGQVYVRSSEP